MRAVCTGATSNAEDCLNSPRPEGSEKMADCFVAPPQCTESTHSSSRLEIISFFRF